MRPFVFWNPMAGIRWNQRTRSPEGSVYCAVDSLIVFIGRMEGRYDRITAEIAHLMQGTRIARYRDENGHLVKPKEYDDGYDRIDLSAPIDRYRIL